MITAGVLFACTACGQKETGKEPEQEVREETAQNVEPAEGTGEEMADAEDAVAQEAETEELPETEEIEDREPIIVSDETAALYDAKIAEIRDMARDYDPESEEYDEMPLGIMEVCMYSGSPEDRLENLGYWLMDLNNDGSNEILIADVSYEEDMPILAIYTFVDDEFKLAVEGWARNRIEVFKDGTIYNIASGGASYAYLNLYTLAEGSDEILPKEQYFTYENEDLSIGYYKNTDGSGDPDASESITQEDFDAFFDDCDAKIFTPPYVKLSDF